MTNLSLVPFFPTVPLGSAVFEKSRFLTYSFRPIYHLFTWEYKKIENASLREQVDLIQTCFERSNKIFFALCFLLDFWSFDCLSLCRLCHEFLHFLGKSILKFGNIKMGSVELVD